MPSLTVRARLTYHNSSELARRGADRTGLLHNRHVEQKEPRIFADARDQDGSNPRKSVVPSLSVVTLQKPCGQNWRIYLAGVAVFSGGKRLKGRGQRRRRSLKKGEVVG